MVKSGRDSILIVASRLEQRSYQCVWGTGGWVPAEQREALDWVTLSRLLGWSVTVREHTNLKFKAGLSPGSQCIIAACNPDCLGEKELSFFTSILAMESILIVVRAGLAHGACARIVGASRRPERITGRSLRWIGPGPERNWRSRTELNASYLEVSENTSIWATLNGAPIVVARRIGRGVVATLGFQPSEARDNDGSTTALLKNLLIWGSMAPVVWLDFSGNLVLRMDDPGGAQNVYNRNWSYEKICETEWTKIGAALKRRQARMSICYTSGWVDDGDAARGLLKVAGAVPRRIPGQVYPSPLVTYKDRNGHKPGAFQDYASEFRGIQWLRKAGLGDVELHGYTHMHPDTAIWLKATDRYESTKWYRELGYPAMATIKSRKVTKNPLVLGISAIRQYFQIQPTTLICPGDEWTDEVLESALNLGLHLVSSYYLALGYQEQFFWTQHVCAPYLDQPDSAWFDSELPVVGYFHDYDVATKGINWMGKCLDQWKRAGAQKLIDFRELAAAVCRSYRVEEHGSEIRLKIRGKRAPQLVRPLKLMIRGKEGRIPSKVSVSHDDKDFVLEVNSDGHTMGCIHIPSSL